MSPRTDRRRRAALVASLAASLLLAAEARAEPRAVRIDYQAHEGCPAADVLVEEITWRTALARVAAPGEAALAVRARITKRGAVSRGRLSLGEGREKITREISGASCDEVVSALALVTALAIDPRASTGRRPPPPPPPRLPRPLPPVPPRPAFAPPAPAILGPPLPAFPLARPASPPRWKIGARASAAFEATPRPLFGAAVVVERAISPRLEASVRVAIDVAATGGFDVGPGGASFLRAIGRVEGCVFALRPARWMSIVPCVGAESGVLRGEGILRGSLKSVDVATVPWAAAGVLPIVAIDVGGVVIEAQGGPVFPLVRREFLFETPAFLVHEVPAVTGTVSLGVGYAFP